ncbi:hypothetical protein ACQV5M_20720, partial [Leptospira sp. SA-E8]|uniref:hypothetical protein n=1 Tax=Leptospira sp. SA-E8 TaxID=3422259 RepID=UPI003EB8C287
PRAMKQEVAVPCGLDTNCHQFLVRPIKGGPAVMTAGPKDLAGHPDPGMASMKKRNGSDEKKRLTRTCINSALLGRSGKKRHDILKIVVSWCKVM